MFNKKTIKKFMTMAVLSGFALSLSTPVLAQQQIGMGQSSVENLTGKVESEISNDTFYTATGDAIGGDDLFKKGQVTVAFDQLKEDEKTRFLQRVDEITQEQVQADAQLVENIEAGTANSAAANKVVTDGTVSEFWAKLSRKDTVASRMIVVASQDFRPDFFGASQFLAPFAPTVGVATAVFIILSAFAFFFFLAVDLFYFMTPPFQLAVQNKSEKGFMKLVSGAVSTRAVKSLEDVQSDGGNPLIKYAVRSWVLVLAWSVLLLFFASNSLLTLIGPAANLVSGLLGF